MEYTMSTTSGEIRKGITFEEFALVFKVVFEDFPFLESWSNEAMLEEYNSFQVKDGAVYGYYLDGKCVGILTFRPYTSNEHPINYASDDKVMYLSDVAILQDYRRKGYATHLLHCGIHHFKTLGYNYSYLRTTEADAHLEKLYFKVGFERIPGLYQGVERLRIDGTVQKDIRFFMEMDLSSIN